MSSAETGAPIVEAATQRLTSLDALRGFDMFWIVGAEQIVSGLEKISDAGPVGFIASQLKHKEWAGFAFEDFIFPLFVFLTGVAIAFSLPKLIDREGRRAATMRVLRRFVLLFTVGVFYYGGFANAWPAIRLMGVLQRIAFCYAFAGLIFIYCKPRMQVAVCALLLVAYWAMMMFIPVPGFGAGVLEPGKNLANYVDFHWVAGRLHNDTWDPEGLLSTIPAISSCLLGVFAGQLLRNRSVSEMKKVAYLIGLGAVGVALGFLWGIEFPVIKKIWTSSYVLVAGGYSAMLLGAFYLVVDVWQCKRWATPFVWIGANALTIYMAVNLFKFEPIAKRFVGGDIQRMLGIYGPLAIALVSMGLVLLLAQFLYKRRIFLRL